MSAYNYSKNYYSGLTAFKLTNIKYISLKLPAVKVMITIGMATNIVGAKILFDKILIDGLEVNEWQRDRMLDYFTFSQEEVLPEKERLRRKSEEESEIVRLEKLAIANAWYEKLTDTEKNYVNILSGRYVICAPFI